MAIRYETSRWRLDTRYPRVSRMRQVVSFATLVLSRLASPPSLLLSRSLEPPERFVLGVSLRGSQAPITPAAAKCDPLRVMECANYNIC